MWVGSGSGEMRDRRGIGSSGGDEDCGIGFGEVCVDDRSLAGEGVDSVWISGEGLG